MRVTLSTPYQLEVHDSGFWGWVLGILLILMGSGAGFLGLLVLLTGQGGQGPVWVPIIVGVAFVIAGVFILMAAQTTIHRFDRQQGVVTVAAKSLRGKSTQQYWLADLSDVVLEEKSSRNNDGDITRTYRVVYVFHTGERVPWTPYSTGTRKDKETCVFAVQTFLGSTTKS